MLKSVTPREDESLKLEDVEKLAVSRALEKHHGNYSNAARELGISRTTLYLKIKKYGL
jgi:transcriptional regulator of acetoin/glycerol metabolism